MSNTPEYRTEARLTKNGPATAVVRTGPKGGISTVAVYTTRAVAVDVRNVLNLNARFEV
jgi:hypothetical protein